MNLTHKNNPYRSKRVKLILLCFISFSLFWIYRQASDVPSVSTNVSSQHSINTTERKRPGSEKNECHNDRVQRNIDPNHTQSHLDFWRNLSQETKESYKLRWQRYMSSSERQEKPVWNGRGIVLVAGNRDTLQRTLTAIKVLRYVHHCKLDIEVWHLNDEQPSEAIAQELKSLGATPRDLSDPELIRSINQRRAADKQFQIKAAAIMNSAYKEVLYLDSDNLPAEDPTFLFDTKDYQATGALFWPDFWKTHAENGIFGVLDIPCQDEWEQESGQMVIDKEKSWLPLQLAWYMQKNYEIYFQFLNGDKDTFKYAWKALDVPYTMVEAFVGMAGTMVNDRFCGHTMLQYFSHEDEDEDRILFVHSNLLKITDKRHFIQNDIEIPWEYAKKSTLSHRNTYIRPEFYVAEGGRACMDFTHRAGEPDAVTEPFDMLLPNLRENYFKYGGIGGETRVLFSKPPQGGIGKDLQIERRTAIWIEFLT